MRQIILRLTNHTFFLCFYVFMGILVFFALGYLIFSNWINFSDAWNEVHPSIPLVNDRFFNTLISMIKAAETRLDLSHHLSRLISSFDYGHGYAIVQTLGTFVVETLMMFFGWHYYQQRILMHAIGDHLEGNPTATINIRKERSHFLLLLIVFTVLTIIIWAFDFILTYAKQEIITERTGEGGRFVQVGPAGAILLMTLVSVAFAAVVELTRKEVLQVISDIVEFFERLFGVGSAEPYPTGTVPVDILEENERRNALPHQSEVERPDHQETRQIAPEITVPALNVAQMEIWGINGYGTIPPQEINRRWQEGEIRVNGRFFQEGVPRTLPVGELFQAQNPPEDDEREWYYTSDGLVELGDGYELGENNVVILGSSG